MTRKHFCFACLVMLISPTLLFGKDKKKSKYPKPNVKNSKRKSSHGSHAGRDNRDQSYKKEKGKNNSKAEEAAREQAKKNKET